MSNALGVAAHGGGAASADAEKPGVTAVVVSYNSARHFSELGRTLASGSLPPARMLAVDNDSRDDSVQSARAAGFEVIRLDVNRGFGAGCNAGLHAAATEFVLICNPDVRPAHDALELLLAALTTTPGAAIAGAALHDPVQARRFSRLAGNLWNFLPPILKRRTQQYRSHYAVNPDTKQIAVDFAEGAFILCRASALRAVDGFDERFFLYSEEEDLARRLRARGWSTVLVPAASAAHGGSRSSEGVDGAVMAPFRFHSLYWYYRRYHRRAYAELARCSLSVCVLIDQAYCRLTGRRQRYAPRTARAAFRTVDAIRRDYEQRAASPSHQRAASPSHGTR